MKRYQIQLEPEMAQRVREQADRSGASFSSVVRDAVEQYLTTTRAEPSLLDRWQSIVGAFRDVGGRTDVSTEHDRYAWDH